jgi:hypothetical protein
MVSATLKHVQHLKTAITLMLAVRKHVLTHPAEITASNPTALLASTTLRVTGPPSAPKQLVIEMAAEQYLVL